MVKMDKDLRVRLPARMVDALELAAQRQLTSISTYTRQTLFAQLVEDGLLAADGGERHSSKQR